MHQLLPLLRGAQPEPSDSIQTAVVLRPHQLLAAPQDTPECIQIVAHQLQLKHLDALLVN